MKTKVVCATAFLLLNVYFATALSTKSGGLVGCIGTSLNNLTQEVGEAVGLVKEVVSVGNETVNTLRSCVEAASASGNLNSASLTSCVTVLYAKVAPEIQDIILKYEDVVPALENQINTISNCLDGQ